MHCLSILTIPLLQFLIGIFCTEDAVSFTNLSTNRNYKILVVLPCYRGHFNPGSGIARALIERNHKVTIFTTDLCEELARAAIPGAESYHSRPVQLYQEMQPGMLHTHIDFLQQILIHNATTRLVQALDNFTSGLEKVDYDAIFMDIICYGAVPFGLKHEIPTISQYMGVIPRDVQSKTSMEFLEIAVENPEDDFNGLSRILSVFSFWFYHFFISWPMFEALSVIHTNYGLQTPNYHYGIFPIGYVQRHSIYIAHGADPIVIDHGYSLPNVYPIGFIPDDVLYPDLTTDLKQWLDSREDGSPIVYVSLGTVLKIAPEEMKSMFSFMQQQEDYYFIWAVRKSALEEMGVSDTVLIYDRLFAAPYLPQGKVLGHPKVQVFVTHCGSNSVQDGVFAAKPMLTFPGVGDQPRLSNSLVANGVAKLMTSFSYGQLETSLKSILGKSNYMAMKEKLERFKKRQIELGGFQKGAEIIEAVIEKQIVVDTDFDPLRGFGVRYHMMNATLYFTVLFSLLVAITVLYKLTRCLVTQCGKKKEKTN